MRNDFQKSEEIVTSSDPESEDFLPSQPFGAFQNDGKLLHQFLGVEFCVVCSHVENHHGETWRQTQHMFSQWLMFVKYVC